MTGTLISTVGRGVSIALLAAVAGCSTNGSFDRYERTAASSSSGGGSVIGTPGNPESYEVFGRRYFVMNAADGYRERGVASWYGPNFHGKKTSNGEVYNMHGMTAAHKTLPIPTWVEVTNLDNNRKIVVRVNDRGPFVDDRIIDLSYRAASELDMVGSGTARVRVRALEESTVAARSEPLPAVAEQPAPAPVVAPTQASREPAVSSGFALISSANAAPRRDDDLYLQVGAYSDRSNALGMVSRLQRSGYANAFLMAGGSDTLYRVRIGPLSDQRQFDQLSQTLRSLGVQGSRLVSGEM